MPKTRLGQLGSLLFFFGLFTCTWDKLLTLDTFGFTLKIHQLFFFSSLLASLYRWRQEGLKIFAPLKTAFPLTILGLAAYYALSSPLSTFPLKSTLYAGWLAFNLLTIWFSAILLSRDVKKSTFLMAVLIAIVGQSIVVLIDHVAYYFGYIGGLIGFNQDAVLKWGTSRPHAFSSEPSYISSFLCFGFLLIYAAFLTEIGKKKIVIGLSLLITAIALIAVTSRTGWIASFVGAVVLVLVESAGKNQFPWKRISTLAACIFLAFAIFYVATPKKQLVQLKETHIDKYFTGEDGPSNARWEAHKYAVEIAKQTHWLGCGLGASYKYWTDKHEIKDSFVEKNFSQKSYGNELIMSIWGQLLAEGGLPAVLLYLAAAYFLSVPLIRSWRKRNDYYSLGALTSALIYFCFVAFLLGNVARGDVWVWFAIWSRMALPDVGETSNENSVQRA